MDNSKKRSCHGSLGSTNQKRMKFSESWNELFSADKTDETKFSLYESDFLVRSGLCNSDDSAKDSKNVLDEKCSDTILSIVEQFAVFEEDAIIITKMAVGDLNNAVKTLDPSFEVVPFGSHVSGLACMDSDLDFFLRTNQSSRSQVEAKILMNKIAKKMFRCPEINKVIKIGAARIPIVRLNHKLTKKQCDLSFSNEIGVRNTLLVKHYLKMNKNLRYLVMFIKFLLKRYKLHGVQKITTYMLFWLAVYYMQHNNFLPPVERIREEVSESYYINEWDCRVPEDSFLCTHDPFSIFHHVKEFVKFYSNFPFLNNVISPFLGCTIPTYNFEKLKLPHQFHKYLNKINLETDSTFGCSVINLQDPTEHNINITKQVVLESLNQFQSFCHYLSYFFTNEIEEIIRTNQSLSEQLPVALPEKPSKECLQYFILTITADKLPDNHPIKHTFHQEGVIFLSHVIENFMQNVFSCAIEAEFSNCIKRILRKYQGDRNSFEVPVCSINCVSNSSVWRTIIEDSNIEISTSETEFKAEFILDSSPTGKEVRIFIQSKSFFIAYMNFNLLRIIQQAHSNKVLSKSS